MASDIEMVSGRQVFSIACRHGGKDCLIEVGKPCPLDGTEVLSITALGPRLGFRVSTAAAGPDVDLGRHVYSVVELA